MKTSQVTLVRAAQVSVLISIAFLISGCVALLAAPLAPVVGGLMPNKNKFVIDEATVTPELRTSLAKAKKLDFVSMDTSDQFTAEYLESHGGYEVTLDPQPKAASPSQLRRMMKKVCKHHNRPDLVFSYSAAESNAGGGTTLKGMFTGRVDFTVSGIAYVEGCHNNMHTQFSIHADINQGMYSGDQTQMPQIIGTEYAKALMKLAGKMLPSSDSSM